MLGEVMTGSSVRAWERFGAGRLGVSLAALGVAASVHGQTMIYVDASAPAGGDGTSWDRAYRDLQEALTRAERVMSQYEYQTPWVNIDIAKGTYRASGYGYFLSLGSGLSVTMQGGFAGRGAPDPNEIDYTRVQTIITADRLGNDGPNYFGRSDNAETALTVSGYQSRHERYRKFQASRVRLAGGTRSGLAASGSFGQGMIEVQLDRCEIVDNGGASGTGGLACSWCWTRVTSTLIAQNKTMGIGGGVSILNSGSINLFDCRIEQNFADFGGGVGASGTCTLSVSECLVSQNDATVGGGIAATEGSRASLWKCRVLANHALTSGGGLSVPRDGSLYSSLIADNTSGNVGGGLVLGGTAYDCTIAGNTSPIGAGVHVTGEATTLSNSILARNVGSSQASMDTAPLFVSNTLLVGGVAAVFNPFGTYLGGLAVVDEDPRFVAPGEAGDGASWGRHDFRLRADSPCVDRTASGLGGSDLDGTPRPVPAYLGGFALADLGCYELPTRVCAADVDDGSGLGRRDGSVTVDDLVMFMAEFNAGGLLADLDDGTSRGFPDRSVTIDDLVYFLRAFAGGC